MSKQQDSLRQAQEIRENKYTLALKKRSSEEAPVQKQSASSQAQIPKPKTRGLKVFFAFFIAAVFIGNIVMFFTLRTAASKAKENKSIKKSSQTTKPKAKIMNKKAR